MNNPYALVVAARLAAMLGLPSLLLLAMLFPAQTALVEAVAAGAASLLLIQASQLALPWSRRDDALRLALAVLLAVAATRGLIAGPAATVAGPTGVLVSAMIAHVTLAIERMRDTARQYGNTAFSIIRIEEDRRRRRAQTRASQRQGAGVSPAITLGGSGAMS